METGETGNCHQRFFVDLGNHYYVLLLLALGVTCRRREYELVVSFVWGHDAL